jgi:hypothetical protein
VADVMFNIARSRLREYLTTNGADLIIVLLKAAEADDTLRDYDNLATLLAASGNTEADFTNYARKVVNNVDISVTVDDTNNRVDVDIPDQTWTAAGGATNNTLVKLLVCVDGANDTARIPVTAHDFALTTDGGNLVASPPAGGFYRSQ